MGQKQPPEVFYRKSVLKNPTKFTRKHLCQRVFFNKVAGLRPQASNVIKKEALTKVFSCEFCEISRNIFFTEHLRVTASDGLHLGLQNTLKNLMGNSTGCIRKQYASHHTCTKEKFAKSSK